MICKHEAEVRLDASFEQRYDDGVEVPRRRCFALKILVGWAGGRDTGHPAVERDEVRDFVGLDSGAVMEDIAATRHLTDGLDRRAGSGTRSGHNASGSNKQGHLSNRPIN